MATDLENAFTEIRNKRSLLDALFAYVNGPQPLKYSTERLEEAFGSITTHFEISWLSVVVDAPLDRLQVSGFDVQEDALNERFASLFDKLHLDIEADKAHFASLSTTQGYIIAWKNGDEIEAYYNDPRLCAVFYDPSHPNVKLYAAKWFNRIDETQEITLYYPERIEHWISNKIQTGTSIDKASAFFLQSTEPNPYGVIPVFELKSAGEISKVTSDQDAINKLFSDMMVVAEYGTFPQRYVISNAFPGALKNSPNQIWWLPGGDGQGQQSSAGQFSAADLSGYWQSINELANSIAVITRTPKHYFMTTGANVSGEALLAMEAPLVKKVQKRQREFAAQWQDIAAFLMLLDGVRLDPSTIWVVWDSVESVQPKTEAEVRQLAVNTGIPLITVLRREGWGEDEIEAMMDDKELQDKAQKTLAQATLAALRIKQQQENPEQSPEVSEDEV